MDLQSFAIHDFFIVVHVLVVLVIALQYREQPSNEVIDGESSEWHGVGRST